MPSMGKLGSIGRKWSAEERFACLDRTCLAELTLQVDIKHEFEEQRRMPFCLLKGQCRTSLVESQNHSNGYTSQVAAKTHWA